MSMATYEQTGDDTTKPPVTIPDVDKKPDATAPVKEDGAKTESK